MPKYRVRCVNPKNVEDSMTVFHGDTPSLEQARKNLVAEIEDTLASWNEDPLVARVALTVAATAEVGRKITIREFGYDGTVDHWIEEVEADDA